MRHLGDILVGAQKGVPREPKKGPILGSVLEQFWGPKRTNKMGPKLVQQFLNLGSIFGSLLFEVLELLGCLLGAFLGLLRLSWEASGPQKH